MRVRGETWREWAASWAKVWAVFFGFWLLAGVGAVLWLVGYRVADDEIKVDW